MHRFRSRGDLLDVTECQAPEVQRDAYGPGVVFGESR